MTLRNSILFLFIPTLLSACSDSTQKKQYSITTYFTSFDSSSNSMGNEGKKFKYSYEEYNSDSNLIYQELYATTYRFGNDWGKLFEKTKFYYNGKEKLKAEREFGLAYKPSEKGKVVYTYEYTSGKLTKWLADGKPVEEYKYNNQNEQVEKRIINGLNVPEYYRSTYDNGIKTRTQYFVADTIVRVDTFIYDINKRLIDKYSYDSKGQKAGHTQTLRNVKGQAIEEKWREPFNGWRMRNDGQIIEDEFYQSNKYYYENKGRASKTEFYDIGRLRIVYEFQYDD
jgi:hypothetical protein